MTDKNVPLARKTMEHIEAHPEEWNQVSFKSPCGTTMCFAGTALVLSGHTLTWDRAMCVWLIDGKRGYPDDVAAEELGISSADASDIFYNFTADPAELRRTVETVFGEAL